MPAFCYIYGDGAESPLAWRHAASPTDCSLLLHLPENRPVPARRISKGYGIAKLLPLIVPVKGETLQVVSSAMTGLVRGWRNRFPQEEFMVCSQMQLPVVSGQWPAKTFRLPGYESIQRERRAGVELRRGIRGVVHKCSGQWSVAS
jgi:hypothetical protein